MKTTRRTPSSRSRTVDAGRPTRGGLSLGKIMFYAPIALEVANLLRQSQKKKRGKFAKARKRDRVFDFVLDQANRYVGGKKKPSKRGWF